MSQTEKPERRKSKPRKSTKKPSQRMKVAASKLMENHGNISKSMLQAGYSPNTAKMPSNLTNSKGWQTLMSKYLSDRKLTKKHSELLEARHIEHYTFPASMTNKEIKDTIEKGSPGARVINLQRNQQWVRAHFSTSDNITQTKNLELAYKIKGRLKVEGDSESERVSEEIREVIFRIRKILPAGGQ